MACGSRIWRRHHTPPCGRFSAGITPPLPGYFPEPLTPRSGSSLPRIPVSRPATLFISHPDEYTVLVSLLAGAGALSLSGEVGARSSRAHLRDHHPRCRQRRRRLRQPRLLTQVVNAALFLPLMWFMVRIVRDREVMGEHTSGRLDAALYLLTIGLVGLSVGALAVAALV